MGKVQLLSDHLINKIAAGEVVERPASVVKELVENSIDAGATRIDIDIKRGGKDMIKVTDNGSGMTQEDALMALKRHATSKIKEEDDLFNIITMGFRGEAIPSIASVSHFTLETRHKTDPAGTRISVQGGQPPKVSTIGRAIGTTITVNNLFFNIPARKKFLRTDSTEFSHITETITRLSLAHPAIRFRLTHNGRLQFDAPATHDLNERISSILGQEIGQAMYPFQASTPWLDIRGLFSRPDLTTRGTKGIYLFVNNRFFRHHYFAHACREAYRSSIEKGRYPYIILFLELHPSLVDVNVHPQKIEVRFQKEHDIYQLILFHLRQAVSQTPWTQPNKTTFPATPSSPPTKTIPSPTPPSTNADETSTPSQNNNIPAPQNFKEFRERFLKTMQETKITEPPTSTPIKFSPLPDGQNNLPLSSSPTPPSSHPQEQENFNTTPPPPPAPLPHSHENPNPPSPTQNFQQIPNSPIQAPQPTTPQSPKNDFFSSMRYIGQFASMYLLLEKNKTLILLDQHAAHERISYQKLLDEFQRSNIQQQQFLIPIRLELGLNDAKKAEKFLQDFEKLGIELAPFGGRTFAIKSIPTILKHTDPKELVRDVLEELAEGKHTSTIDEKRDDILMRMACHSAIRGKHKLTSEEAYSLLQQLDEIDFKANCPHGRPIYFELSQTEIEKRFHRT